jgi:hypothetical protein
MQTDESEFLPLAGARLAAIYAALAALVMLPVLTVQVPLLGDYPNHLARIHILEVLGGGGPLDRYYEAPHRLVPYQAMDVVVAGLRHVLSLYAAGRVFVALCLLVPPAAAAALRWAVTGRVGLAPAAAFLLSYNFVLARGLLDYLFAAGLAVALFALWLRTAAWPRWGRASLCGAGLVVVFLGHAFAGVAYCIMVAGEQLGAASHARWQPREKILRDWAAAAAQAVPCLVLVLVFGASGAFGGAAITRYGSLAAKIGAALSPVYFPGPGVVVALFALLPLAALGVLLARRVNLAPALRVPALVLAVAALAAPSVLFNAWATDMRLPIVLAILLVAAVVPTRPLSPRAQAIAAGVLVALVTLRAGCAFVMLQALDVQAAQVRGLALAMKPGARLLVVDDQRDDAPLRVAPHTLTEHAGLLATVERDAFVPFLLSGATPVVPTQAMASSSSPNNAAIDLAQLRDGLTRTDPPGGPPPYGYGGTMYWLGWPKKFDYVMVMSYGTAEPPPGPLVEVAQVPIGTLYRVLLRR